MVEELRKSWIKLLGEALEFRSLSIDLRQNSLCVGEQKVVLRVNNPTHTTFRDIQIQLDKPKSSTGTTSEKTYWVFNEGNHPKLEYDDLPVDLAFN